MTTNWLHKPANQETKRQMKMQTLQHQHTTQSEGGVGNRGGGGEEGVSRGGVDVTKTYCI